jgi:NADPH:quinone reductase-like Zn-dependent oxidoreductase
MALGVEAAGTITAIGDSVEDWEPGDEVLSHPLPLRDQGAWAPLLIASATVLARKPASLSWEAAAAFPVPALTCGLPTVLVQEGGYALDSISGLVNETLLGLEEGLAR